MASYPKSPVERALPMIRRAVAALRVRVAVVATASPEDSAARDALLRGSALLAISPRSGLLTITSACESAALVLPLGSPLAGAAGSLAFLCRKLTSPDSSPRVLENVWPDVAGDLVAAGIPSDMVGGAL